MIITVIFASVLKALRTALGWVLMVLGGFLGGISALCAIFALFGGLETESFGEQLGLFAIFLILTCVGLCVLIGGRWIKNGTFGKKPAKPATQKVPKPKLPQPSEDQKRLEEVERNLDHAICAVQANPMTPGKSAYDAEIAALEQEKQTRLRRMARHMEAVTVQDAWNTFTPEQQKRFDAQVYQYSQDVGRGGLEHEIAAANRGLVFVDASPVPKEVAARFEELKKAAAAEKERKINMTTLQPMDYPVPFTELLIYPNRIVKRPKTAQVLQEEESGAFGSRSREAVYLFEENGRTVLVCEKQRQDEHSPQEDSEWSMRARLSLIPQHCHRIPLTKWALSLPWKDLRQYTDEVCVRTDGTPTLDEFHRFQLIKVNRMKNSHDQLGWNCTFDEIVLCSDRRLDVWYLRRESHWREAPSGLPYNVTILMKLLPGVEKKSDEELCGLMNGLPWWDPNSADRLMWDARNWLDMEWLQKLAEFNDSMHKKNPRIDGYEKALEEVLKQLCLLEEPKPAVKDSKKSPKVTRWVNLIGEPGQHGDVIRIGFGDGKCYLEITNDGFPHGNAGGMMVPVPGDVIAGSRLDARKFLEFYRSIYPGGVPIDDFTDRIWFYLPTPGRPEGTVELIKELGTEDRKEGAAFSFEKTVIKRDLVKVGGQLYLRITNYECSSGGNGRPLYSLLEDYHVLYLSDVKIALQLLTPENGLRYAAKSPAYRYAEYDTGVLF